MTSIFLQACRFTGNEIDALRDTSSRAVPAHTLLVALRGMFTTLAPRVTLAFNFDDDSRVGIDRVTLLLAARSQTFHLTRELRVRFDTSRGPQLPLSSVFPAALNKLTQLRSLSISGINSDDAPDPAVTDNDDGHQQQPQHEQHHNFHSFAAFLARIGGTLEELRIHLLQCKQDTDSATSIVAACFLPLVNLRFLKLDYRRWMGVQVVEAIANGPGPALRDLRFQGNDLEKSTFPGIRSIGAKCVNLEKFRVNFLPRDITSENFDLLAELGNLRFLTTFNPIYAPIFTIPTFVGQEAQQQKNASRVPIERRLACFPLLRELTLTSQMDGEDMLPPPAAAALVAAAPQLEVLHLRHELLTQESVTLVCHGLRNLTHLELQPDFFLRRRAAGGGRDYQISVDYLPPKLEVLLLATWCVNHAVFARAFKRFYQEGAKRLRHMEAYEDDTNSNSAKNYVNNDREAPTDDGAWLEFALEMPMLETFKIYRSAPWTFARHIDNLPKYQLKCLELFDCGTAVNDSCLATLAERCGESMEALALCACAVNCCITDNGLRAALSKFRFLRELTLRRIPSLKSGNTLGNVASAQIGNSRLYLVEVFACGDPIATVQAVVW